MVPSLPRSQNESPVEEPNAAPNVEKFLREQQMSATRFGRLAANDPRFVLDLRDGPRTAPPH